MATPSPFAQRVHFGDFELDLSTRELWTNGTKQTLAPQPFKLLQLLIESRGRLVTRDDLVRNLWPSDTFVDYEQGLKKAVNRLREALSDSAEHPRFIETLPRQGYRFMGVVEVEAVDQVNNRIPESIDLSSQPVSLLSQPVSEQPTFIRRTGVRAHASRLLWTLAGVALLSAGLVWRIWLSRSVPPAHGEPKISQLTANSPENPVTSSAISPDGKYLAFADSAMNIKVKLLESGETQTVLQPDSLKGGALDWSIAAWFPDSTRFLVNASPPGLSSLVPSRFQFFTNAHASGTVRSDSQTPSIWIATVLGKTLQKLRDDALAFSVSPHGSSIAFGTSVGQLGDREIWLMDARGLQGRRLYETELNAAVGGFSWSGNGERGVYLARGPEVGILVSRDLQGGPPIPLVQFSDWQDLIDFVWLPDGRLLYAQSGKFDKDSCNLWELRVDSRTGRPVDKPQQLTKWSDVCVGQISVTADGKRVALQRWAKHTTVSIADITAAANDASTPRHLTLNEYVNAAETWTPDGNSVIFRSVRDGRLRLFRQALDSELEQSLVMGAENVGGAAISPDGSWLLYLDCGAQQAPDCEGVVPLMRIPMQGGTPHEVLKADTYGRPRCTFAPATLCLIAEQTEDGKPLIFTAFDALKGRGAEVARFETEPAAAYHWGSSPDGTRIAIVKFLDDRIHVISLNDRAEKEVAVNGESQLRGVFWAADGKGWFTVGKSQRGTRLLYVDLQGKARPLWEFKGDTTGYGLPSPDGRHLAIVATARNNNVWLMENF